jgi:hypothetical protein
MTSDTIEQWNALTKKHHKLLKLRTRLIDLKEKSLTRQAFAAPLKNEESAKHTVTTRELFGEYMKDLERPLRRCEKYVISPGTHTRRSTNTTKVPCACLSRDTRETSA